MNTTMNVKNCGKATNVSVVSLLNSSARQDIEKEKEPYIQTLLAKTLANSVSAETNSMSPLLKNNLPTVANSDLLYKSIVTTTTQNYGLTTQSCASTIQSYEITTQSYGLVTQNQELDSQIHELSTQSHGPKMQSFGITTLANQALPTVKLTNSNFHQIQPQKTNDVAQTTRTSPVILSDLNVKKMQKIVSSRPQLTTVTNEQLVFSTVVMRTSTLTSTATSKPCTTIASQKYKAILVPRGWNRTLEKDTITYISPNRSRLRCRQDLVHYLTIDGTCKCGLECPIDVDKVFNFDPKVASTFGISSGPIDSCTCKIHKKFLELFPPSVKLKVDRRGRKPGQKTKRDSSDDCTSPDRKRISLTGVSPLEMFQSGMNAINSLSPFVKKENVSAKKLGSVLSPSNKISKSKLKLNAKSKAAHSATSNTILNNQLSKLVSTVSPISVLTTVNNIATLSSSTAYSSIINSLPAFASKNHATTNSSVINPLANLKQKKPKKTNTAKSRANKNANEKKNPKKALPNVEIQKASDLQLHHSFIKAQGKTIFVDPKSGLKVGSIPSLRSIASVTKTSGNGQIINVQSLLPNQSSETSLQQNTLRTIQAVAVNQSKTSSVPAPLKSTPSPKYSSNLVNQNDSRTKNSLQGHVIVSMPPNLTVSSADHLNEALLNQLASKGLTNASFSSQAFASTSEIKSSSIPLLTQIHSVDKIPIGVSSHVPNLSSTSQSSSKQVNTPINSSISKPTNQSQPALTAANGPMLLLHFVSQPNLPTIVNPGKINSPVLRTYSVNNQSSFQSPVPSNVLVMNNRPSSNLLSNITSKPSKTEKKAAQENKTGLLQIQNINSLQNLSSQISPNSTSGHTVSTIPVHYVQTVSPVNAANQQQGLKLSQTLSNTIPIFQYLQSTSPFMYSGSAKSVSPNKNFVRIAPGPSTGENSASSLLQQIEKHNIEELRKIQEELFKNSNVKAQLPVQSSVLKESIITSSTKNSGTSVIRNIKTSPNTTPPLRLTSFVPEKESKTSSFQNTQQIYSGSKSNISATIYSKTYASTIQSTSPNLVSVIATPSSFIPAYVPLSNSLKSKNYQRSRVHSVPPSSQMINEEIRRRESLDEMLLKCNEKPMPNPKDDASRHSRAAPNIHTYNRSVSASPPSPAAEFLKHKKEFISSLVWIESPGSPPWPGRTLCASQLRKSELPPNQVYVVWYGSHHVQPVNIHSLKSFFDPDLSMRFNLEDPRYRTTDRSQLTEHEIAIAEALQDVALIKKHAT